MKDTYRLLVSVALALLPHTMTAAPTAAASVPNVALVQFQAGTEAAAIQAITSTLDLAQSQRIGKTNIYRLQSRSKDTPTLVAALKARSDVVVAEPDYIGYLAAVPNEPWWPDPGLWDLRQVAAPSAWNVTTGSASVVVGVIDSGVRYTHEDVVNNMWSNPGGIGGCAAGTHGYDAFNQSCDPSDSYGHGTEVAGVIGAQGNNGKGLTGINWTTSVMALRVSDDATPPQITDSRLIDAIDFAVQAKLNQVNVRVLNCSCQMRGDFSQLLLSEIDVAGDNGILLVVAAGNYYNLNLDDGVDADKVYPASYNLGNMITVAAGRRLRIIAGARAK